MHIIEDKDKGLYTLVPMNEVEEDDVRYALSTLQKGEKLKYRGIHTEEDGSITVYLHIGGTEEPRSQTQGNVTVHDTVMVGGRKMSVSGTNDDDKELVGAMRYMCYVGTGGLIFMEQAEIDGRPSLVATGLFCKHCDAPIIGSKTEWKTCSACVAKCEHVYETGFIHGPGVDIGVGKFCKLCGTGKPREEGEPEKTLAEHHLDAIMHGIDAIIYK